MKKRKLGAVLLVVMLAYGCASNTGTAAAAGAAASSNVLMSIVTFPLRLVGAAVGAAIGAASGMGFAQTAYSN